MPMDNPYGKHLTQANPYGGYIPIGDPDPVYPTKGPMARAQLAREQQQVNEGPLRQRILAAQAIEAEAKAKQAQVGSTPIDPRLDKLTGVDYRAQLPAPIQAQAQALIDGRMSFPSGAALRSPYWQEMLQHVSHIDPSFDAVNYNSRAATRRDFVAGKSAQNIRALNTALGHLGQLDGQISGTASHGGFPFATTVNGLENAYERGSGASGITNYEQTAGALSSELTQVFRGSGGAEADINRELEHLSPNGSMDQKKGAVRNIAGLLKSRLDALGDQYQQGMGTTAQPLTLLNPHAQEAYNSLGGFGVNNAGPKGGGPGGGSGPSGAGGPDGGLATGMTRTVDNTQANKIIDSMIRAGANDDAINAALAPLGAGTVKPEQTAAARDYLAKNPGYKGSFGGVQADQPTTFMQRTLASPAGAFVASANNALTGGLSGKLTGTDAALKALADANPTASTLGDITGAAGGAALTGFGLGAAGRAAGGLAGRVLANPLTADAVFGGVSGANSSSDPLAGGLEGAALGASGGFLGRQIGGMFAARRAPGALNTGETLLANRARQIDPATITSQLSEAQRLGVPMSLTDTGGPLATLGGQVVRRSPDAAQIAQDAFGARARGQIDRLGQSVTTNLGPVGNVPQISADLLQQARTTAGPLYDAAYSSPGAGAAFPQIEPFLGKPSVQNALGRAKNIAAEEGRDPTTLGFDFDAQGNTTLTRVPSWQTLDYVKRGLDDTVDAARDPLTKRLNTLGNAQNNTRMAFLGTVDAANPAYAQARRAYAGPMEATNALQAGQDGFSANPSQLGVDVANAAPGNLPQMQLGYRSALMDKANSVRYASNPFDATLGTPAAEQRLATMYPNNPGTANLLRTRDLEGQLARTNNTVLGNSLTAARQVADADFAANPFIEAGLHGAAAMATGGATLPGTAARIAGLGLKDRIALGLGNKAVAKADQLAPYLFNTNPAQASDALTNLLARQDAYGAYINNSAARRLGGMFGAGLGLLPVAGQ